MDDKQRLAIMWKALTMIDTAPDGARDPALILQVVKIVSGDALAVVGDYLPWTTTEEGMAVLKEGEVALEAAMERIL